MGAHLGPRLSGNIAYIPTIRDSFFKAVTLLLNGDGTNGAQNNTFLDSSTNNFTITRNGNTTQGTNTPFSQAAGYWSNYFNGTTDYLTAPVNTAFTFGTGDFTVECWIYATGSSAGRITNRQPASGLTGSWGFNFTSTTFSFSEVIGGEPGVTASGLPTMLNTWTHLAASREGSTLRLFANGILVGSGTFTNNLNSLVYTLGIGATYETYFSGYISNLRIVKGTAVYTAAFTPPTTPLTAITNTSLLTCQSNYFKDNSSNNFALTITGTPSIQPFSPFAPTSAYSTSVNGGSMYFDGTGDYLKNTSGTAFTFGTGDFTIEYWTYTSSFGSGFICHCGSATTAAGFACGFNTGSIYGTTSTTAYNTSVTPPLNQWIHIVWVRSGTTLKCYLNGSSIYTTTVSTNFTETGFTVGAYGSGTNAMPAGYLSNFRVVKGTAVYTSAFTPPTAPLTAITNTSLLLSGTNAGIFDNAMKNDLETVGDAQISTSVVKYGTGSMKFDGTGDYLTIRNNDVLQLGTGDFTIEFWAFANTGQAQYGGFVGKRTNDFNLNSWRIAYGATGANTVDIAYSGNVGVVAAPFSLNTWNHVAFVRSGTTLKVFVNGVLGATGTGWTYDLSNTFNLEIGTNASGSYNLNGYIDDLRITKGIARYTANFTSPTASFPIL